MQLVAPLMDYMISIGPILFPMNTAKSLEDLALHFQDKINEGKAFIVTLDRNGPKAVLNPAPGMVVIVMTKEQFERNQGIKELVRS